MAARSIHILQMGKHFLYLPIYYAEQRNFFGYLPKGVTVVVDAPGYDHTDRGTYDKMMDPSVDFQDFEIAITDPIQIFRTPLSSKRKPAVLATLVTNAAFWAVDHGGHEIKLLGDLALFDRIVAYSKGTTSYNIAARAARESGKVIRLKDFIHVVSPGQELTLLKTMKKEANTVVLSPDILSIEHMTSNSEAKIELALGDLHEYNDVIATALISNNEFVSKNPDIVTGLIKGIQKALLLTRRFDSDVVCVARSSFHYADKAEGALHKAITSGVLPTDVKVAQAHWMSTARVGGEISNNKAFWHPDDQKKALEYYLECIQPYERFREEALSTVDNISANVPKNHPVFAYIPMLLTLGAIGVTALVGWIAALSITIGLFIAWGIVTSLKTKTQLKQKFMVAFAIVGATLVILPLFGFYDRRDLLLPLGWGFIIPALLTYVENIERKDI